MIDFETTQYGPVCQTLLTNVQPADLGPGQPNRDYLDQLAAINAATVFSGQPVVDPEMAACCESGLWLLHHYLDESHQISQKIHTPTGSYWHGIMHRREPDFSNAKYWFRKVGDHPIFESLNEAARQIAVDQPMDSTASFLAERDRWDPAAFVDLCAAVTHGHSTSKTLCQLVAFAEWKLLFDFCFRSALGTSASD